MPYLYVPIETLIDPPHSGPHEHFRDHYWQVVPGHGAVLYRRNDRSRVVHPQANVDRGVVERLTQRMTVEHPAPVQVVQLAHAYLPIGSDGELLAPRQET